jgi:hypothetical protein
VVWRSKIRFRLGRHKRIIHRDVCSRNIGCPQFLWLMQLSSPFPVAQDACTLGHMHNLPQQLITGSHFTLTTQRRPTRCQFSTEHVLGASRVRSPERLSLDVLDGCRLREGGFSLRTRVVMRAHGSLTPPNPPSHPTLPHVSSGYYQIIRTILRLARVENKQPSF